jgi:hypothetical protein
VEFRESINHPRDPANTTPATNPATNPNATEDRGDPGDMSQDYHRAGRAFPFVGSREADVPVAEHRVEFSFF